MSEKKITLNNIDLVKFFGANNMKLDKIKSLFPDLRITSRGEDLIIKGSSSQIMFFEQKSLYATKGEVPDGEHVEEMGKARVVRDGDDVTIVALAAMVPRAVEAADRLQAEEGISASVVDLRSLVPLDTTTIFNEIGKTGRLVTVEENPRLCGWGAEVSSIVAEERFWDLDMPILRITTPHIPLPSSEELEDIALPSVARIFETVRNEVD